jgi:hypothetical protein
VEKQEQIKDDRALVGRRFWVGATGLVLLFIVLGAIVGFIVASYINRFDACGPEYPGPVCAMEVIGRGVYYGLPAGALAGLVGGVLAVRRRHRQRIAHLTSAKKADAE